MSEIKSFKLVGGDEIVAEVLETKRSQLLLESSSNPIVAYIVRRPHILQFQPVSQGRMGLVFVPWTLSNPTIESMDIPVSAIVLTFTPSKNVEDQYIQQTTGLEIPKQSTSRISV